MALISIAVYDTPENGRSDLTLRTLDSLWNTVEWRDGRHRLVVVDNGSTCPETRRLLDRLDPDEPVAATEGSIDSLPPATLIRNAENRGTARAVNQGWLLARPGDCVVKADNDFTVEHPGWLDRLEECVARDPLLGVVGLKRPDLEERPDHDNPWYRSSLHMLPHKPGERWLAVERVRHALGTCVLVSPGLRAKIGFLYQRGLYGLDDADLGVRCELAGFYSAFLVGEAVSHIDPGATDFTEWKRRYAGEQFEAYVRTIREYAAGTRPIYRGPDEE